MMFSRTPAFSSKYQLPFPLLSDPDGHTAAAYDSLLNLGLVRFARRHTFIITPDGRIAARFDKVDPTQPRTGSGPHPASPAAVRTEALCPAIR